VKRNIVAKSKEVNTELHLAESSMEGFSSESGSFVNDDDSMSMKGTVLPMMMMMMILCP
jgi:hypothetical protein